MKRVLHYIPSVLVAALITYLCVLREPTFMPTRLLSVSNIDKAVHLLMFACLSLTFFFDFKRDDKHSLTVYFSGFVLIAIYGGIVELVQHLFVESRTGDTLDFIADLLGTLIILIATICPALKISNT